MPRVDELPQESPASIAALRSGLGVVALEGTVAAVQDEVAAADSKATAAQGTANTAATNAGNALTAAQAADTKATTAQTAASTAQTAADAAQSTATAAQTAAATAQSAAEAAQTAADDAQTTADTAQTTATTALNNSNAATTTANTAATDAASALTTAQAAQTAAGNATTAASTASDDAAAALSAAQAAQSTADGHTASIASAVEDATAALVAAGDAQTAANTAASDAATALSTANTTASDLTALIARVAYLESVVEASTPADPVNTVLPTLDGPKNAGDLVTATPGTWTGNPTPTITRQWYLDDVAVSGATGLTYQTEAGYEGSTLYVRESAENGGTPVTADSAVLTLGSNEAPSVVTKTFSGTNGTEVVANDSELSYVDDGTDSSLVVQDNMMAPGNMVGGTQGVYVNNFQYEPGQGRRVQLTVGAVDASGSYFILCVATDPLGQNQLGVMIGNGYALVEQTVAGTPTTLSGSEHYPTIAPGDIITIELNPAGTQVTVKLNGVNTISPLAVPVAIDAGAVHAGVGFYSADTTEAIRIASFEMSRFVL